MIPHLRTSRLSRFFLTSLATLNLVTAAYAADYYYFPNGTNAWNTAVWRLDGGTSTTPTGAHNYFVSSGLVLRTTDGGSSTFGGGSLTVSGQLNLQAGNNNTNTANLIFVSGAVVVNARPSTTQTIAGTLQLGDGNHYFKSTGIAQGSTDTTNSNKRNMIFTTLVSGGADATAHFLRNGDYTLSNAGNTFAGTWKAGGSASVQVDGPLATVSNSSGVISTIKAATAGSLGINASVALDAWSRFDADFDWTTTGSLTLASNDGNATSVIVTLDQDFTVGLLSIAGNAIAARTQAYTYTDLFNLGYGDYFTDGGGSITVSAIPEPSTAALFIGCASLVFVICPRRRNAKPSAAPAA